MRKFFVSIGLVLVVAAAVAVSPHGRALRSSSVDHSPSDSSVLSSTIGHQADVTAIAPPGHDVKRDLVSLPNDTREMVGALVGEPGSRFKLLELVWGINFNNEVCVSRLVAEGMDGVVHEHNSSEQFIRVTTNPAELSGSFMRTDGGRFFKVHRIQYGVNSTGTLVVAYLETEDSKGALMAIGALGAPCCDLQTAFPCQQRGCAPPSLCYGYVSCPCNTTGQCGVWQVTGCRGGCPGGDPECTGVCTNNIMDCRCY